MSSYSHTLEDLISLCKRRGFVYPASEIYGGMANTYNFGPLGAELMRQLRRLWWEEFINYRDDMVGLDTAIMLHPQTWVASGHVDAFNDPLVEDKVTHKRYRADHLIEEWLENHASPGLFIGIKPDDMTIDEMATFLTEHNVVSPDGNEVSEPKTFNLLFETAVGSVAGEKNVAYLRGETAQGIFTDFKQVVDSTRVKLPFGIGNIGKSFRNEITTGQFVFRTLEFEQAEIEYFFDPEKDDWVQLLENWKTAMWDFVTKTLKVDQAHLRWRQHSDKERSHYSKDTYDLDYEFPFGFKELWGVAYRTDYDLKQHQQHANQSLEWFDQESNRHFLPHVIEPALGISRLFLMVLNEAYWYDETRKRTVLKFDSQVAPYQVAVFPLVKNKPELVAKAREVYQALHKKYRCNWDDRGNIGKRYLYQDEMGTPFCVTIDYDTLEQEAVTIRHRDTTEQTTVKLAELEQTLRSMLG